MNHATKILVLIFLGAMLAGCPQGSSTQPEVQPDSNSGGDDTLAGARGVFDDAVNDNVDATTGDNTDMKYIEVDGRGELSVRVRFHAPDVAGSVALMNEFGDVLREQPFALGTNDVRIDDFDVFPGRYYVRVHATEGKSDYTIGRDFARDPNWLSPDDIAWRDQQIELARQYRDEGRWDEAREILNAVKARFPENPQIDTMINQEVADVDTAEEEARRAEEEARASRRSHRSRSREREEREEPEETPTEETPTETPAEEPEETSVRANIVTIRDRGAGSGVTLILTGCGTSSGLSEGARGRIGGTGERATITRITGGNSCEAESSASAGAVGSASYVSF